MQALVVDRYKTAAHLAQVPEPAVGPQDVLVEVRAAGVNPLDAKLRDGELTAFLRYDMPLVLGHDVAGVVLAVGAGVTRFAEGDEVVARVRDGRIGTFAERIAVHEDDLARKPGSLSMVEAAALPLVALTAWQALVERGRVGPGSRVLVHAGSGGLGSTAVQLAKHLGATVTTTAGTSNLEWVRALGVDEVVDHRTQDFAALVRDQDLVLDTQGGEVLRRSLGVLRPGGLVVGVAGPPDAAFARQLGLNPVLRLAMTALSARVRRAASRRSVRYEFLFMRADGAQLQQLADLVDQGALRPVVDRTFALSDGAAALAQVETGRSRGKVVLTVRD